MSKFREGKEAKTVTAMESKILVEGFTFPEGPRWHDGALFVSDQYDLKVWKVTKDSEDSWVKEEVVTIPKQPSGTGW